MLLLFAANAPIYPSEWRNFSFDHMFKISLENPKILQQWVVAMQERFQGGNFENQDLYNFLDQLES